ncbi:hypothetical protein [Parazoarcus communis]|uniref:RHS repeat protein n=1 Tax=Parazoarcus communis SWub3 = DSM 12120 TaxID=1121029 RepID=A0A323UMR2_9RHOO|nr:hypothetical protein [Parazoarcus communis]NMG72899.1 hypothetical protein [Parazoarcus communis SWub3 = DSM 12120]PZA14282.1 hypothetical protein DNK49_22680 [Azoarcus communis] [Parazoarcus communis SWub3 = DSM 12120]
MVTTTTYNTANKYVPQTVVADAGTGKLNLTTAFTYDGVGNLTQVNGPRTDVTDTTAYAFNAQRRITQTTDALGKQTRFGYDNDGRLIRTAAQLGTQWLVSCRSYSATGKLLKAWGPAVTAAATTCPTAAAPVAVTDYAYDDLSRRTTVTLGNGTTTSYGYSPQGALASLSHNLAGTAQDQTLTYTRNPVQEIVSQRAAT